MNKITYPVLFSLVLGATSVFAQGGNKVTICHIPPGNPANAHSIEISVNAVSAHINPNNNNHNDFIGDCYSACNAMEVVSYVQGKQSNGSNVPANRSNVSKVLQYDGQNRDGEFFSLGFGGHVIVKMEGGIINRPGNDLKIYETSFGQPACSSYPEQAEIWVSKDNVNYHLAGTVCQDGEVDIAPLDWIQYVKIVDVSVASQFGGVVDGFDVDGITCVPYVPGRAAAAYNTAISAPVVTLAPNPVSTTMNITFFNAQIQQNASVYVYDLNGRMVLNRMQKIEAGDTTIPVDVTGLKSGIHFVTIESEEFSFNEKIMVK